jgi:dTDP-glucose 4,6-dehydratase
MKASVPEADLDHILAHTRELWQQLSGARLFITGGTGFFGIWLLEAIVAANDRLNAGVTATRITATLLSRDPALFARLHPQLANRPEFNWLTGDVSSVAFPQQRYDYLFHFATPSAAEVDAGDTALTLSTLAGMHRILQFSRACGAKRLLFTSSGAVYGRQPTDLSHVPETYPGAPDPQRRASAYGEIKRMSELLCALTPEVDCVIARGFAFLGPHLPLTDKFAVGSFIRQALAGGAIRIHGDGTPVRSYLYAADMVIWLLTLLMKGKPGAAYNVGSDQAINLADLARLVGATTSGISVHVTKPPSSHQAERYVPSIDKAKQELGLNVSVPLAIALRHTLEWAKQHTTHFTK